MSENEIEIIDVDTDPSSYELLLDMWRRRQQLEEEYFNNIKRGKEIEDERHR